MEDTYLPLLKALSIRHLEKEETNICFYCSNHTLKKIEKLNIPFEKTNVIKQTIVQKSVLKKVSVVGLILLLVLFFLNQLFLREISFSQDSFYDENVYQMVKSYTKKRGPYLLLEKDVNEISRNLRTTFYYYGYVGVYKKGSKLIIDIKHQDIHAEVKKEKPRYGELIAKYNARIDLVDIESGVVIKIAGETIKKGEVIVTSNLKYQENLYDKASFVPLVGHILGTTYRYEKVEIKKTEQVMLYTGNYQNHFKLWIGSKEFSKNNTIYPNASTNEQTIFSLFNKIKLQQITTYEKKSQEMIHDKEEARRIALAKLKQNFEEKRVDKQEKIVLIKEVECSENTDEFVFLFLVNCYENIVEYRPFL